MLWLASSQSYVPQLMMNGQWLMSYSQLPAKPHPLQSFLVDGPCFLIDLAHL